MTYRSTKAIIHLDRLRQNYVALKEKAAAHQSFFALLKADAYGHDALAVAKTLVAQGVTEFGVATIDEAMALRKEGFLENLIVLNGLQAPLELYQNNNAVPMIHSQEEIKALKSQATSGMAIALKVDTGMGRLGFFAKNFQEVLRQVKSLDLNLKVVFTHLARADEGKDFVNQPHQDFLKIKTLLKEEGFENTKTSFENSAATVDANFHDFDWYRPGIALYGAYPHPRQKQNIQLLPVLEWQTQVMSLKTFSKGSPIGYGGTFVTERESQIAILPIGYADGYSRLFSNRAQVLVHGKRAPVVGRVSMDLTAIDVTDIPKACYGDTVTLIGKNGDDCLFAEDLADWAKTISYEVFCNISKRVPRIFKT